MLSVEDVLSQIEFKNGRIKSLTTGNEYEVEEFVNKIASSQKWSDKKKKRLLSHFVDTLNPQSDKSINIERFIEKYNIVFSDGVYTINGEVISLEELYRFMWKREKLLPDELTPILQNVELISEPVDLQRKIYEIIYKKLYNCSARPSEYLKSLDLLYPNIPFRNIIHNILMPDTNPMFHIFYDDGVGGTGKSTLLEVLTLIVGEENVSNVLLDQFGNRFVFSNMLGKYLNIGDDNGKNDELQNVGTLKSIVTGGRVTIDRKFMQPLECRIKAKQLFATNIMPYIDFTDGGLMRRLNIVPMNKVIPKTMKLCRLDEVELSRIFTECINAKDLETNSNELAVTSSPLYRFYTRTNVISYSAYKQFCADNGFRCMNVINYEAKLKFIENHIKQKERKIENLKETSTEDMPF